MRGSAKIVTNIVRASARSISQQTVTAWAVPLGVLAGAKVTDTSGFRHFLNVAPEEPQQLLWLHPQYGIDYAVTTSTGLKWQIK